MSQIPRGTVLSGSAGVLTLFAMGIEAAEPSDLDHTDSAAPSVRRPQPRASHLRGRLHTLLRGRF